MAKFVAGDEKHLPVTLAAGRLLFGLALGLLLSGGRAQAATATATFTVTANVATNCNVVANNLDFGAYSGVNVNATTGTTTINAACTTGTPYTLGLNQGTSPGATVTTRAMTGPGATVLNYGLFQDAGHTINWGNTPGSDTESGTGIGAIQTFTVFGDIPASQHPAPGNYSDTITVTLTF